MASLLPLFPIRLVPDPARAKPRKASSQPSLRALAGETHKLDQPPRWVWGNAKVRLRLPNCPITLSFLSLLSPFLYPIPPTSLSTLPVPPPITSPTTMSTAELACSYAALILADDGVEVTVRTWPLLSVLELCAMDGRIIYWDQEQEIICGRKGKRRRRKKNLSRGC